MTPQLQAAIATIEPLNAIKRQHLLQILLHSHTPATQDSIDLETQSRQFWDGIPLQQLRTTQTPAMCYPDRDSRDFWPETETIDDFLTFLDRQRHQSV
ncbi:MAG: hypothetical protein HC795_10760 [Coleofasciculaceae cyanobacterium RL_1_1]|nr:hypothetical protein [Coleofasciculaceae cyanobacterium RL_1_1]